MTSLSFMSRLPAAASKGFIAVVLVGSMAWMAACGGGETGGGGIDEPITGASEFLGLGGSGVTGQAEFSREGGILTVDLLVENVRDTGDHPSHIHEGTCREPGGVVVPLNAATVSEPGIVETESQVQIGELPPGTSYVVMIHSQQGAPIGCAELPPELLQR